MHRLLLVCRLWGGATAGVPFITWGLMVYPLLGEVVPDLAKINIIGGFGGLRRKIGGLQPMAALLIIPLVCLNVGQLLWVPTSHNESTDGLQHRTHLPWSREGTDA